MKRRKAIAKAISNLNTGNVLIVAGKGHEKTQQVGNKKIFLSDRQIILNSITLKGMSEIINIFSIWEDIKKRELGNKF